MNTMQCAQFLASTLSAQLHSPYLADNDLHLVRSMVNMNRMLFSVLGLLIAEFVSRTVSAQIFIDGIGSVSQFLIRWRISEKESIRILTAPTRTSTVQWRKSINICAETVRG